MGFNAISAPTMDRYLVKRFTLAGLPVDPLTAGEMVSLLDDAVDTGSQVLLANINLNGLHLSFSDDSISGLMQHPAALVHIDGTPIRWLARFSGVTLGPETRNTHIDLIPDLLRRCAERGLPVVLIGGSESDAQENSAALTTLVPGLRLSTFAGYLFDRQGNENETSENVVAQIQSIKPALLLVGMGMPRQERWILRNAPRLSANVIMPVGGFADYFAGRSRMPPRFLGHLGLEWLYRLVYDPKRLAKRYLVEPILLGFDLVRTHNKPGMWSSKPPTR